MFKSFSVLIFYLNFIFFSFHIKNIVTSKKILEEFKKHSKVWISVYNEEGESINSTYNKNTSSHSQNIRVEFKLEGQTLNLQLTLNKFLFSPNYKENYKDVVIQDVVSDNCFYIGRVYRDNEINNDKNIKTINNKNNKSFKNNMKKPDDLKSKDVVLIEKSQVAISTCEGIRGWVWLGERSLHIEPAGSDVIGWHFVLDDLHAIKPVKLHYQTHDVKSNHRTQLEDKQRKRMMEGRMNERRNWRVVEKKSNMMNGRMGERRRKRMKERRSERMKRGIDGEMDEWRRRWIDGEKSEKRRKRWIDGEMNEKNDRRRRGIDWPYDHDNNTLIIELYVVNDHAQYKRQGSNMRRTIQRTKNVVNILNSLYRPLNIYVALVGLEVWEDHDRMNSASSTNQSLDHFLTYRDQSINYAVHNDNAQLISGKSFNREDGEGVVGRAPIMTMCSWKHSGGINIDHSEAIGRLAVTMAHELGHNLGMTHDSTMSGCPHDTCIMSSFISNEINPTVWSEESKDQLRDALLLHIHYCLRNLPLALAGGSSCGNGFVEDDEECDCGLPQDCTSVCCDARTCRFKSSASCATGTCCDLETCQLRPTHYECRPIRDSCDLPEYCSGTNETCPFDVFKHNGVMCNVEGKEVYCYDGECRSHDTQCRMLWGPSGRQAHDLCYTTFNPMGNVSGNCGSHFNNDMSQSYLSCNHSDVLCGMLHCEHENEKLMFWKESNNIHLLYNSLLMNPPDNTRYECKGVVFDMGVHRDNPGMVPNGASCGDRKICASQRCMDIQQFVTELKCPECHGNGICNSLRQCHCNNGYSPPDCSGYGLGGSLHSNPSHAFNSTIGRTIGILLVVLILLSAIIFVAWRFFKQRNFILKDFSLSNFRSVDSPKKNYYKNKVQKQQQPLPQLPSSFMSSSAPSRDHPTAALLSKPPPKMPPVGMPPSQPPPPYATPSKPLPPRIPPKMKLSSTSFSANRKMPSENEIPKSASIDLKKALQDPEEIDFIADKKPTVRTQPFRKAPPPPPQFTNQDEDEKEVHIHSRPIVAKRHHIINNKIQNNNRVQGKTNTDSEPLQEFISLKTTSNSPISTTTTISSNNKSQNRRSKVLNKPSIKPPPPPKPKI